MAVSLFTLGLAFQLGDETTITSVVAIGSLMLFVASFAISLGPIFWLINSEIYPLRTRSKAASLGTFANWIFNFIVSLTFLLLIDALGQSGAFWLYAAVGILHLGLLLAASSPRRRAAAWRRSRPSSRVVRAVELGSTGAAARAGGA